MNKNAAKHEKEKPDEKAEKTAESLEPQQMLSELKEYKEKYVRLYAELENTRKRHDRERLEYVKYAQEELIHEFLNILDDLERTVAAAQSRHEDHEALLKGIEMVMAHIYEMLKRHGVTPIDTKGKVFDPHLHEILMQEETNSHEDSVILEEFQKGYMLNDRVIRTAKVKIARQAGENKVSEKSQEPPETKEQD